MLAHAIAPIDVLVVNLYPFEATIESGAPFDDCVENIDIGGPAMIRAAAKNFNDVAVVVDRGDYPNSLAKWRRMAAPRAKELRQEACAKSLRAHRRCMIRRSRIGSRKK